MPRFHPGLRPAEAEPGRRPTTYHYYADVALAVCEGPVTSVYRVWLDRTPLDPEHVGEVRTYFGDETQTPDPLIQAVEGAGRTPAFRGLTYLVLENLYLTPYGNHFPNFEVEVYRGSPADTNDARHLVRSVCLIPASGEWAYEPTIVRSRVRNAALNTHTGRKASDFAVAIENLGREVPNVEWISLVYAWFGTSIDVATCSIRPECEYAIHADRLPDTTPYLWSVMGIGRPVIGGFGGWPLVSSYVKAGRIDRPLLRGNDRRRLGELRTLEAFRCTRRKKRDGRFLPCRGSARTRPVRCRQTE